jgi:hypothetical protein
MIGSVHLCSAAILNSLFPQQLAARISIHLAEQPSNNAKNACQCIKTSSPLLHTGKDGHLIAAGLALQPERAKSYR